MAFSGTFEPLTLKNTANLHFWNCGRFLQKLREHLVSGQLFRTTFTLEKYNNSRPDEGADFWRPPGGEVRHFKVRKKCYLYKKYPPQFNPINYELFS